MKTPEEIVADFQPPFIQGYRFGNDNAAALCKALDAAGYGIVPKLQSNYDALNEKKPANPVKD